MELVLPWIRNRGGTLSAKGSMKMTAEKELDNETGRLLSDGDMDISASVLSNKNGTASSGKNITIKGTRLDNAGGTLSARDGITLHADRSVNNAKGRYRAAETFPFRPGCWIIGKENRKRTESCGKDKRRPAPSGESGRRK